MLSKLICVAAMVTSGHKAFANEIMFEPVSEEQIQDFPLVESIGIRMEKTNGNWFKKTINNMIDKVDDYVNGDDDD